MAVIVDGGAAFRGIIVQFFIGIFADFEDWRFVSEAVDEQEELGLITDGIFDSDDLGLII